MLLVPRGRAPSFLSPFPLLQSGKAPLPDLGLMALSELRERWQRHVGFVSVTVVRVSSSGSIKNVAFGPGQEWEGGTKGRI